MGVKVLSETVGPFSENSYFLVEPRSREAVAIDPGDEPERLLAVVRENGLKVLYILNTHGHLDHVGAVARLKEETGAPFYIHRNDLPFVEALAEQAQMFGLVPPPIPSVDGYLEEGQIITFGNPGVPVEVIETPGHSPGSVTFHVGGFLVAGDVLFQDSIGRTDIPGGDTATLLRSIHEKLLVFPDNTAVYPGHGPATTIGRERRMNPFLSA